MAYTIAEVASDVRYYLGGLSCDLIDDTLLTIIISKNIDDFTFPDDKKCKVVYDSVLATLRYLINKLVTDSGLLSSKTTEASTSSEGGIPAGAITKKREKIGKREIEVTFADGSSGSSSSSSSTSVSVDKLKDLYEEMLDDYIKNPQRICESLIDTGGDGTTATGNVIISNVGTAQENAFAGRQRTGQAIYNNRMFGGRKLF